MKCKGYRVLIVEDDSDLGLLVKVILSVYGFECTLASSFTEGVQFIEHVIFDFLIVDLMLPDGYGLDLAPLLAGGPNQNTPFIVASGNISPELRTHPRILGTFQKPYDVKALARFMEMKIDTSCTE